MSDKKVINFYNRLNLPPKDTFISNLPSKVEESPLDARSPQEVLEYHGMYRDPSYYEKNPDKLYLDLTQFDDYETYLNNIRSMESKFMKLSPDVRAKFNNNISEFAEAVSKPDFDFVSVLDSKTKQAYEQYKERQRINREYEIYKASVISKYNSQSQNDELQDTETP